MKKSLSFLCIEKSRWFDLLSSVKVLGDRGDFHLFNLHRNSNDASFEVAWTTYYLMSVPGDMFYNRKIKLPLVEFYMN